VKLDFEQYLQDLRGAAREPAVVAFFDLDRTLIAGYSVAALAFEQIRSREMSLRHFVTHAGRFLEYGLGRAGYHDLLAATVRQLVGRTESELVDLGQRAYRRKLQGLIYQEARALLRAHDSLGHQVVMVTSATRFQAEPIAADLGIANLCCTELEIRDGRVTGECAPCFGDSKVAAAVNFATQHGGPTSVGSQDLLNAYFYTDSSDDLPLLEAVTRPVTVNAKQALVQVADRRGWPQLEFQVAGENLAA
jgi:putative phosphoserine phosphatase/1-acylglycerol-3-phosphate O-acyltransferase